jgi:hypothetical protein
MVLTSVPRRSSHPFAAEWFDVGLRIFATGIVGSITAMALAPIPQMTVLGAVTLGCAILGVLVCAAGVHAYDPARWRGLRGHFASFSEWLHGARGHRRAFGALTRSSGRWRRASARRHPPAFAR